MKKEYAIVAILISIICAFYFTGGNSVKIIPLKDFFKNPEMRLRNLFNYIDARDLGQMVDLCINKNGLGFDVFNIANELNSVNISNEEIIKRFYPQVKIKREIKDFEALYSSQKAKKLLGFHEKHSWKMYMNK